MRKLYLILFSTIFVSVICKSQEPRNYFDASIKVDTNNIPLNNKQFYFPEKLFPKVEMIWETENDSLTKVIPKIIINEIDSGLLTWYSRFLYAMKEPLLFNHQLDKEVYRFTWLRTFHNPITIRIEKYSNVVFLRWKMTDGKGGYKPGQIIIDEGRKITNLEWGKFISLVNSAKFWKSQRCGVFGNDGSEWILEGVEPTRYYVTSVWLPHKQSDFYKIGAFLLELTDLKIEEEDKY